MGARPAPHPRAGLRRRRRAGRGRPAGRRSRAPPTPIGPASCASSTSGGWPSPTGSSGPSMLGYAAYADRFAGTLRGVEERVPYLRDLGVTYLHLMPLLTPRPGPNDGGYAVQDYRSVRPDLGDVDDLRALATTLRGEGISLCLDLVLNHVAREHAWAAAARAGDAEQPRLLPRLRRPRAARRLRGDAAGGLPRLRARQLHLGRRARGLGLDDLQRLPVGRQLVEPRRALRVRRDHPGARQPRGRGLPARRHRLHLEAARHGLPERARGARADPRAAHGRPDRRAGGALQGRGDRGPGRPAGLPRRRRARRPGERPRLPQRADGPGVVDARLRRHAPRRARAAAGAATAVDHRVDDVRPVPRRHRVGDRRRGRAAPSASIRGPTGASCPTGTPAPTPARGRAGWSSSATRRPATGASPARWPRSPASRRATRRRPPGSCWPTRSCSASAGCR